MNDSTNFPNKKHDYVRILLDLKPEHKDDITIELLCNILLQQRVNYELLAQLFRAQGLHISGWQKQTVEGYYENESVKLSAFLARFAQNIDYKGMVDTPPDKP